jgi:hypothetical protein
MRGLVVVVWFGLMRALAALVDARQRALRALALPRRPLLLG